MVIGVALAVASTAYSIYSGERKRKEADKYASRAKRANRAGRRAMRLEAEVQKNQLAENMYRTGRGSQQVIQALMGTKGTTGRYGSRRFNRSVEEMGNFAGILDARRMIMGHKAQGLAAYAGQAQSGLTSLDRINRGLDYGSRAAALGSMVYNYFDQPTPEPEPESQYSYVDSPFGYQRQETAPGGFRF